MRAPPFLIVLLARRRAEVLAPVVWYRGVLLLCAVCCCRRDIYNLCGFVGCVLLVVGRVLRRHLTGGLPCRVCCCYCLTLSHRRSPSSFRDLRVRRPYPGLIAACYRSSHLCHLGSRLSVDPV